MWTGIHLTEQDRRELQGILFLLVSMSGLAEQALRLPALSCLRVLHLADAIAWRVVFHRVRGAPQLAAPLLLGGGESLPRRLLALVRALARLLGIAGPSGCRNTLRGSIGATRSATFLVSPAGCSLAWLALRRSRCR